MDLNTPLLEIWNADDLRVADALMALRDDHTVRLDVGPQLPGHWMPVSRRLSENSDRREGVPDRGLYLLRASCPSPFGPPQTAFKFAPGELVDHLSRIAGPV